MVEKLTKEEQLEQLRHSAAHVMADAVKRLYPDARITIGPAISDGFYYDFDYATGFSEDDLKRIEEEMHKIVKAKQPFVCEEHGDFVDLCKGPHVEDTGKIGAFKLLKVAGAYWRGDEKREQLQRIYGTAFPTQAELDEHLKLLEEAAKRDHRKIGRELDLFSTMDAYGAGLVLWHPKGGRLRQAIEDFWREAHVRNGYEIIFTPHMARLDLWKASGHWDFYRESMYAPMIIDEAEYELKPMNCPFHIQIYKTRQHSYRELPIRWAELGTVYRYERSGVLHGLMRVRGFTQDDAHIFCRPDQLEDEIQTVFDFSISVLKTFGFKEYDIFLSTKPEKHVGSDESWDLATNALEKTLKNSGLHYEIDPGEGVFYGPKIDIKIKDALNRSWQCTTIQVDFNLPERYQMEYVGSDSARHQPIMIHRALLGSLERFVGVLIEHYAGAFPTWLAPVQASILSITDAQVGFCREVLDKCRAAGLRVELDDRNEKLGLKIREAEMAKVPYMLVVGKKEVEAGAVAVRSKSKGDLGKMPIDEFVEMLKKEVEEHK
jgi:threonyl-tRNA synthetase